jgi:3'-5' exoribonuclease
MHLNYLKTVEADIKDPLCKILWHAILHPDKGDELEKYATCPGGVGDVIHHSYLGGLLEHSASMVKVAEHFAQSRPDLNKDILLTGCLIHDLGKILTYNWATVIEMTDMGRLLHHTTIGVIMLSNLLENYGSDTTAVHLAHIIVSHHQEEGVRKPMTPEAEAVAQIDSLDAAIKGIQQYVSDPANHQEEGNWTRYCNLTSRQYFLTDKKEVIEMPVSEPSRVVAPGMVEENLF